MSSIGKRTSAVLPFAVLIIYVLITVGCLSGVLTPQFEVTNNELSYQPPSSQYWMGTDLFGRSVFARALHATKNAVLIGFFSTAIALCIAVALGSVAGFFSGWIDAVVVWLYTTLDSIPYILLLAAFAFALGQGFTNVFLALGLTSWTTLCKIVRAETMKIKTMDYILAAHAQGQTKLKILTHEILPNISHLIIVQAGIIFISVIKIEVILSFLGLGVPPGTPSWGLMIYDAKEELTRNIWWGFTTATALMFILVLASQLALENLRKFFSQMES
jgi:ABC-type dipeptide/oligopeptide/nickel transport system permease subunit